jgi:hypothetical protein
MIKKLPLLLMLASLALARPVSAQVDLSGTWASRNHEDFIERWPGPDVLDLTGLPINDDARARALAYSGSLMAMPERQCLYYGATYTVIGPFGLKIWSESEPVNGRVTSINLSGAVDKSPRTIWMDGRPHPSEDAPHTFAGFSTGEWQGNMLVITTTHMKASPLRRNGVPISDQATQMEYVTRHGDILTLTAVIDDPAYLTEPQVISRSYQFDPTLQMGVYPAPCTPAIEAPGLKPGAVPHYLAGENPFLTDMAKRYGLPQAATLGGAETMYPEYRKVLEGQYQRPAECTRYCCGWGGGNTGNNGFATAPALMCVTGEPVRTPAPAQQPAATPAQPRTAAPGQRPTAPPTQPPRGQ